MSPHVHIADLIAVPLLRVTAFNEHRPRRQVMADRVESRNRTISEVQAQVGRFVFVSGLDDSPYLEQISCNGAAQALRKTGVPTR